MWRVLRLRRSLRAFSWRRPLVANAVASGVIYAAAEFTQQTILIAKDVNSSTGYDWTMIGRYTFLGSAIFPQYFYVVYSWMDRRIKGRSVSTALKKLLLDQTMVGPISTLMFFIGLGILERQKMESIKKELKLKFIPTYLTSCLFWIPAQSINFFFLPPFLRVIWVATSSFLWINILCFIKKRPTPSPSSDHSPQIFLV